MTSNSAPGETDAAIVGPDGFATLLLSCAITGLSAGITFLAALAWVVRVAVRTPALSGNAERLLVLGMRLEEDGSVPARYRHRLDRARILAPGRTIVLLGGRTRAGLPSEADAGRAYLVAHGVASAAIHLEDRSRHTLENLVQYRLRYPDTDRAMVALISSRFHLARCGLMAGGLGLPHILCAAEDSMPPRLHDLPRLAWEAFLIHWYVSGRCFARLTDNRRMLSRIS